MTDHIIADLSSYVRTQESLTVLTDTINASVTTIPVDDATALSKGTVEIEDELVYIKSVDATNGQVTALLRGYRSTTAATHSTGAIVRVNPIFTRTQVQRAINDTIKAIELYQVLKYDFTFDGSTFTYELPAGTEDVVGVTGETTDSSGRWVPLRHFRLDHNYWPDGATSAKTGIELMAAPSPGYTVRVQYLKHGDEMASGDSFTDTGLPSSSEDVVRLGAMWRLLSTIDPGKVMNNAPTGNALETPVPAGRATEIARYVYQLFSARLAEERSKQADQFFSTINYQG